MPASCNSASDLICGQSERPRPFLKATMTLAIIAMKSATVSRRFPNSIQEWSVPCTWWGTGAIEPETQSGQVGHPKPEPVSRTAPPVTTMID